MSKKIVVVWVCNRNWESFPLSNGDLPLNDSLTTNSCLNSLFFLLITVLVYQIGIRTIMAATRSNSTISLFTNNILILEDGVLIPTFESREKAAFWFWRWRRPILEGGVLILAMEFHWTTIKTGLDRTGCKKMFLRAVLEFHHFLEAKVHMTMDTSA